MDYGRAELANRLAADYVAGLLHGRARRRFEALLPAHPTLRASVRSWNEHLMPLTASIAPVQPPLRVWRHIEARISGAGAGVPAPAPGSWWTRLGLWRALSGVATMATLSLALLLAVPDPVHAPIIVVLDAATPAQAGVTPTSIIASISGDGRALVTRPLNVSVQADRALELWAVPPSGAPRSLGLLSASGATVVRRGKLLDGIAALAVSLEPSGGSPGGAPTGPILYVGKLNL